MSVGLLVFGDITGSPASALGLLWVFELFKAEPAALDTAIGVVTVVAMKVLPANSCSCLVVSLFLQLRRSWAGERRGRLFVLARLLLLKRGCELLFRCSSVEQFIARGIVKLVAKVAHLS